ncbi:HAD family hydrolase [Streptomyces sp. YIM S03343]
MRYDLVIFDNDGVLVDSELISNRHLAGYLTELGHPTSLEDSLRDYKGAAVHRVHDLVMERSGQRLPEDFNEVWESRVLASFAQELEPIPGVVDVLEKLTANGMPYCVASSATHDRIRGAHRKTGLDRWFDASRSFSAQDVRRGKPAPDLFLHAAERMGVPPERCVVVEDSPLGVRAGVAAGMKVLGFTNMTPPEQLPGASHYFADFKDLADLLI